MRHLTRSSTRPGHHGPRRAVLAGVVAGVLALSGIPAAALDDGEVDDDTSVSSSSADDDGDLLSGEESDGSDGSDGSGDDEDDSSATGTADGTVDDTSESVDETVDEPVEDTVEQTVEETEDSLSEVTDPVTGDDDGEDPEEDEEPTDGDDGDDADEEDDDGASDEEETDDGSQRREPREEPRDRTTPAPDDPAGDADAAEDDEQDDAPDGDDGPARPRYLDAGPFDPPPPRAPSQLLRTGYEPFDFDPEVADPLVAESSTPRDTAEIIGMLQGADASESAIARLMAPFPLAGPASYGNDGTHEVTLRTTQGTPVVAAGTGTVAVADADDGVAVELSGHDGTTYRYAGMDDATLAVADGDEVRFGQTLGHVAGFDLDGATLTFALWSPDGEQLPALQYLDRWLAEAESAAGELAGAAEGTFAPDVAPPADRGTELAAPEEAAAEQSGMSPARAEGGPAVVTVGGLLAAVLGAYMALRTRRRPLLEDREGFLAAVDELGPRA